MDLVASVTLTFLGNYFNIKQETCTLAAKLNICIEELFSFKHCIQGLAVNLLNCFDQGS